MGDYVGFERGRTSAGSSSASQHDPAPTPEQDAHQTIGAVQWRVDQVAHAKRELDAATTANDPARWHAAKTQLDQTLMRAQQSLERIADRVAAASEADRAILEHARTELVSSEQLAATTEPPLGYIAVTDEPLLLAKVREAASDLEPILETLSTTELRIVRDRIARHLPGDLLAAAIWDLGPAGRDHVRELVTSIDRTKARARADEVRAKRNPPPAAKQASLDDHLLAAVDSFAPEQALFTALQPAATTARHVLAARLRAYRPGNGDAFAARFNSLADDVQARILGFLDGSFEPKPQAPHDLTDQFYAAVDKVGADYSYEPPTATAARVGHRAENYLTLNATQAWLDLHSYMPGVVWPELGEQIAWRPHNAFSQRLIDHLHASMPSLGKNELLAVLDPHDPFALIERLRPDHDKLAWIPAVGLALGQIVQRVAAHSIARLAPRIAAADLDTVAISHPMDRFVVEALRGAIEMMHPPHAHTRARAVRLAWQGGKDPAAWNWVRAEPADATAEEVVAELTRETGRDDLFAVSVAVASPMFGVPAAWARTVPAAAAHMPRSLAITADTPEARVLELARAGLAPTDDKAVSPERAKVLRADVGDQLASIHGLLVPWGFGAFATESLERVPNEHDGQLAGQRTRLGTFGDAIAQIDRQRDGRPRKESPLRPIVKQLAGAVAASHVPASEALYAGAMRAQSELAIDAIQGQILDAAATTGVPIASRRDPLENDPAVHRNALAAEQAIANARVTQDRLINGGEATGTEMLDATLATREAAMHSRLDALFGEVGQLQVGAAEADAGFSGFLAAQFSSRFRTLEAVTRTLRLHLDQVRTAWTQALSVKGTDGAWSSTPDVATRRAAIDVAAAEYAKIRDDKDLMTFLQEAPAIIHNQQLRRTVINIAGLIVIAVATMGVGAMVEAGIGGAMLTVEGAEAVGELSTSARLAGQAIKIGTEVAGNALGQTAMDGTPLGTSIADNMMFAAGGRLIGKLWSGEALASARAATRAFDEAAREAGIFETRLAEINAVDLSALGWVAGKAVRITSETLLNTALANVSAMLQGQPHATPHDASELFEQALSVAVGHAVHAAIGSRLPGLHRLAERTSATAAERALLAETNHLDELALALARGRVAKIEYAHAVFEERTRLLEREIELVTMHADPSAHEQLGELHQQISSSRSDALVAMRMNLIGLEELIPGHAWRGTEAELDRAITELSHSHRVAKAHDNARDVTLLTIDDRVFEIHIRAAEPAPTLRVSHELSTDLEMVPGSKLRGSEPGAVADARSYEALRIAALEAMPRVVVEADVNGITHLDGNRFVVDLRDGTLTVIDVTIVRLPDHDVARLLPNSSRDNQVGARTAHGEHTVQLSVDLSATQVERALAHAVARLSATHTRAKGRAYANGRGGELAADTLGRLAELRVLVGQLTSHPESAAGTQREIVALADHLGVLGNQPAARERLADLETHLSADERDALHRAGRDPALLAEVREVARADLRSELDRERQRGNDRPAQYDLAPGQRLTRADLARFAAVAAQLRAHESAHTLRWIRAEAAALGPGKYVAFKDVQIGGGAALSARTPSSLLVDQRGRWQADASTDIAQTAQQLQELYKAHFADVRQVAAPNDRVPLDAIRFWEDSLAAMGPVIDGVGTPRFEKGNLLLDIMPSDGSEMVTILMTGTPVTAPGFVPEAVPGAPRVGIVEVVTTLEVNLRIVAAETTMTTEVREAAELSLERLKAIDHPRATEGLIHQALNGPHRSELEAALRKAAAKNAPAVDTALSVAASGEAWANLLREDAKDGVSQVTFGDEANLEVRVTKLLEDLQLNRGKTNKPLRIVFMGAGGTALSAAEIILARPNTEVMMIGRAAPDGLLGNPQFRALALKHANVETAALFHIKPGDGRLGVFINKEVNFTKPPTISTDAHGRQRIEGYSSRVDHPDEFVGDAVVVSSGRADQPPPMISDLILQTTREGGTVRYELDFDDDQQFTGYTVVLTPKGGPARRIKVTGAASRSLPSGAMVVQGATTEEMVERAKRASGIWTDSTDVPPSSGGFPGGFAGSSVQGSRAAGQDNERRKVTNAKQD